VIAPAAVPLRAIAPEHAQAQWVPRNPAEGSDSPRNAARSAAFRRQTVAVYGEMPSWRDDAIGREPVPGAPLAFTETKNVLISTQ